MATDRRSPATRRAQDRLGDHAAIDRLADELLPALVAKLGASGLGEIEIREGTWRVRLRMPTDGNAGAGRQPATGRAGSRAGDAPRAERTRADVLGAPGAGSMPGSPAAATAPAPAVGPSRVVATSPAVGYFRPRGDLRAGTKVRAGDRIGSVDVLGIGQDVVAPGDGLIGATLVAAGEPVEFGQALIVLEQLTEPRLQALGAPATDGSTDDAGAVSRGALAAALTDRPDPDAVSAEPGTVAAAEPAGRDVASTFRAAAPAESDAAPPAAPDAARALAADAAPAGPGPDTSQPTGVA